MNYKISFNNGNGWSNSFETNFKEMFYLVVQKLMSEGEFEIKIEAIRKDKL